MNLIWLCIVSFLSIPLVMSDQKIDRSQIKVFPAANHSIAGVFQVTYINHFNQPQYAFNASEARELCWSLGLTIASKAQVQEALTMGLETCRFGWIDEHFAAIPRMKASQHCGQNKTGLVLWRASVKTKFDVYCFNVSDMVTQLKDTAADSPSTTRGYPEHTPFPSEDTNSTSKLQPTSTTPPVKSTHPAQPTSLSSRLSPSISSTSLHSHPSGIDNEAVSPQSRSSAMGSIGVPAMALLITSTCALLLSAAAVLAYIKLNKCSFLSMDVKQQEEYIETEEWTCVKNIKDPQIDAQEEVRIDVDNNTS